MRSVIRQARLSPKSPTFNVDAGLYRCAINFAATKLTCYRVAGGTHEIFWNAFGERMQNVTRNILAGPLVQKDAQAVFAKLADLSRLIAKRGSYRWLSTIRTTFNIATITMFGTLPG
jgi:hypothetical protein